MGLFQVGVSITTSLGTFTAAAKVHQVRIHAEEKVALLEQGRRLPQARRLGDESLARLDLLPDYLVVLFLIRPAHEHNGQLRVRLS